MDLIEKGLSEGLITFNEDRTFITYVHQDKKRKYTNPEEQVQAETFLKLVLMYDYPVERIRNLIMGEYFNQQIVVPKLPKQKEIAQEIKKRRYEAQKLEQEAHQEVENARQQIEEMILEK